MNLLKQKKNKRLVQYNTSYCWPIVDQTKVCVFTAEMRRGWDCPELTGVGVRVESVTVKIFACESCRTKSKSAVSRAFYYFQNIFYEGLLTSNRHAQGKAHR